MNERQRLTYLAHLGVDNYVSRRPLKGAAPSVALDTSILNDPDATAKPAVPVEQQEPQERHPPPLPLASIGSAPTEAKIGIDITSPAAGASAQSVKPQSETLRFSLNCWRISDDCLVLDTREFGAALPTDTLLLNILRSMGYPLAQLPRSESLHWPLFSHDQNANDESSARAMVQAYIQAQVSKKPAKHLLLMGPIAAKFTLDTVDDWQFMEGKTFQQWEMAFIVIPSLASMLREPLLKRVTWQAIKMLS